MSNIVQKLQGFYHTLSVSRFNNPVNLKHLIAMINEDDWSAMDVDVKAASEGNKGAG